MAVALSRGVRIVLGIVLTAVVASAVALGLLLLSLPGSTVVGGGSTLVLRPGGDLPETAPDDVLDLVRGEAQPTLHRYVEALARARTDDRITAVVLHPRSLQTPYWAKVQELRDALIDFRRSGKPVVALLEYGAEQEYYLATAADRIIVVPSTDLALTGLASYELFLRGTLDWIGTFPDLLHIGDYKTAVNTFTERTFTPAHREMSAALTGDLYRQLVEGIAEGRKMTPSAVRALIDRGPFTADEAVDVGLADAVGYEDQLDDLVPQLRARSGADIAWVEIGRYAADSGRSFFAQRPRIGVIYAGGTIVSGRSGYDPVNGPIIGSETLVRHIRAARQDTSLRAVVLRIDSPGGSSVASDVIWRELTLLTEGPGARPLIVSMSDLAASGGYYLAMAGNAIVAQPGTLTGSIGVYTGKYVVGGTLGKLGAGVEATSEGAHAQMYSPARPFSDEERELVMASMQRFYDRFVERVARSRGRTPAQIDAVAQGRIWTGAQARDRGLVDRLGGLTTAIEVARERAGLPKDAAVDLVVFPPKRSWYEVLTDRFQQAEVAEGAGLEAALLPLLSRPQRAAVGALLAPTRLFRPGEALALMPYTFVGR